MLFFRNRIGHPSCGMRLLLGVLVPLLGACSSDGGNDWSAVLTAVRTSWSSGNASVSLDAAAAIPYATLGVRFSDGGPEQILLLATETPGERLWSAPPKAAILVRQGRVVETAGQQFNLSGSSISATLGSSWATPRQVHWTADFVDLGLYSVAIDCRDLSGGVDPVSILGKTIDTVRVDENCRSEQLDWTFTNTFWVSAKTGRVWRSIQFIHPKVAPLELEILRPPSTPD